MLGNSSGLSRVSWPEFREDLAKEEQFEIIIQINGRVRGKILAENGQGDDEVADKAVRDARIAHLLQGKTILKTIVVPRKLVNIVIQ